MPTVSNIITSAESNINLAPRMSWINDTVESAATSLKLKQAPKNTWILNFTAKFGSAKDSNWINNLNNLINFNNVPIVSTIHNKSEAICNKSQSRLASLLKILKVLMFHQNNKSAYLTWTYLNKLIPDKLKPECKRSTTIAITLPPLYHSTTIALTTSPLPTHL